MMTFPDWIGIRKVNFKTVTRTKVSEARSYRRKAIKSGGQRWEMTLKSELLTSRLVRRAFAFAARLEGRYQSFTFVLPKYSFTAGQQVDDPKVKTTTLAGYSSIPVRLLKGATQGCLLAGDFIRFSNHSKVYQVSEDVDSSASGAGTILIYPALIETVEADTDILVNNVDFTLALDNDLQEFEDVGSKQLSYLEFDCVEAFG